MTPDTVVDLKRYLEMTSGRPAMGALLPTSNDTRYEGSNASVSIIKALVAQTNVVLAERNQPAVRDGMIAHALRTTFFTFLQEAGAPPRWVADQGGHADASTSLRNYTASLRDRERSQRGKASGDLLNGCLGRGVRHPPS